MNYSEIKIGDVLLMRTEFSWSFRGVLIWLIRFFTKSRFNHVAFVSLKDNKTIINEADDKGIIHQEFPYYLNNKYIKVLRIKELTGFYPLIEKANSVIGTPYDKFNLLIEQPIKQLTGKWIGDSKTNKFICSSYVAWIFDLKDWYMFDPEDFEEQNSVFDSIFEGKLDV